MKKILSLLLVLMVFILAACSDGYDDTSVSYTAEEQEIIDLKYYLDECMSGTFTKGDLYSIEIESTDEGKIVHVVLDPGPEDLRFEYYDWCGLNSASFVKDARKYYIEETSKVIEYRFTFICDGEITHYASIANEDDAKFSVISVDGKTYAKTGYEGYTGAGAGASKGKEALEYNGIYLPWGSWREDGTYKVGREVKPRLYFLHATDSNAEFSVYDKEIYFNGTQVDTEKFAQTFSNHSFVLLEEGEFITTDGILMIYADSIPPITERYAGTYRVGVDIDEGEYTLLQSTEEVQGRYCIMSVPRGTEENILEELSFDGEVQVSVEKGQYLLIEFCEIIE